MCFKKLLKSYHSTIPNENIAVFFKVLFSKLYLCVFFNNEAVFIIVHCQDSLYLTNTEPCCEKYDENLYTVLFNLVPMIAYILVDWVKDNKELYCYS